MPLENLAFPLHIPAPWFVSPQAILKPYAQTAANSYFELLSKIASDPIDYLVADDTVAQPDLLVYCGQTTKPYLDFIPKLVAEILSPSTAMKDRHTKFNLYETAGVTWYLLVNPDTEIVQVFVLENVEYILNQEGHSFIHSFSLEEDCRIEVDFAEIW